MRFRSGDRVRLVQSLFGLNDDTPIDQVGTVVYVRPIEYDPWPYLVDFPDSVPVANGSTRWLCEESELESADALTNTLEDWS